MKKNRVIIEGELVTKAGDKDICIKPLLVDGINITHLAHPIIWVELEKPLTKPVIKENMKNFEDIYDIVETLTSKDGADAEKLTLKAMEELGELSTALLQEDGYKSTDKSLKVIKLNQLEEACDVILCMLAIIKKKDWTHEQIINMLAMKTKKWEETLKNRKPKS